MIEIELPSLLDSAKTRLKAYPRETVVAEKFQAIVALGMANSRMKDLYDLLALSRLFPFEGSTVAAAIRATFERRRTPVPARRPTGLSTAFVSDAQKIAQWRAFTSREPMLIRTGTLSSVADEIAGFVMPAARAAGLGSPLDASWTPPGPWRPTDRS